MGELLELFLGSFEILAHLFEGMEALGGLMIHLFVNIISFSFSVFAEVLQYQVFTDVFSIFANVIDVIFNFDLFDSHNKRHK